MIPVQYRTLGRLLTHRSALEPAGPGPALRRLALVLGYAPLELVNAGALAMDDALFPSADVVVKDPVFILGPPRSGTTFLHRLLERDPRFTTFRLWQILFPARCQQVPVRRLLALDRRLGGRMRRGIEGLQRAALGWADDMHTMRLDRPEEDEILLAHAFGTELLASLWPVPEAFDEYRAFDALPDPRRLALMRFYRGCVQRHLAVEGRDRRLLSKSPAFSHKVASLRETFPDARFILLIRHPVATVASLTSLLDAMRRLVPTPEARRRDRELIIRYVADCYRGALDGVADLPADRHVIVRYEDLAAAPYQQVEAMYSRLGLVPGDEAALRDEAVRVSGFRSRHQYDLVSLGYTHAAVEDALGFVYDRFGYSRQPA